jgi:hypothetical protein
MLLCSIVAACGGGPVSTARPVPQSAGLARAVRMPDSVGTYRLVLTAPLNGAPTDTIHRFVADGRTHISVIRYPVRNDVRVGADSVTWLEREGAKFVAVQQLLVQRGVIQSYEVKLSKRSSVPIGTDSLATYVSIIQTRRREGVLNEIEYLYVIGGKFLKIRASEIEAAQGNSLAPQFAGQLLRLLLLP